MTLGEDYQMELHVLGSAPQAWQAAPVVEAWMDPQFSAIQGSVVNIQRHWAERLAAAKSLIDRGLLKSSVADVATSGADNLRTLALVQAAYRSAASGGAVVDV